MKAQYVERKSNFRLINYVLNGTELHFCSNMNLYSYNETFLRIVVD